MTLDLLILFGGLLGLLLVGAPVFLAMGGAAGLYVLAFPEKAPPLVLAQGFVQGLDSFGFAAIPFFLLAGELMNAGGVSARLIGVARAWLGHLRGGLAQANVGTNLAFAGISGSAVADAAAIGAAMIPAMREGGYPPAFAAALTASAAVLGPVVPPSIALILFSLITDTPLVPLFLGGVVPGLLITAALMATCWLQARRRGFPAEAPLPWPERARLTWVALPALLMPVLVLVALRGGAATAGEVGAVLVLYAALLGLLVYRGFGVRGLLRAVSAAAADSARVLIVVSCSGVFAWILVALGLGGAVAGLLGAVAEGPAATMLLVGAVLIVLGLALEPVTLLVVLGPLLLPAVLAAGVDPVHFGVALAVGSTIGLVTPPVGVLIYLGAAQARVPVAAVVRELVPFLGALVLVFLAVLLLPGVTLALPRGLLPAW